jgi:hypothetical protein
MFTLILRLRSENLSGIPALDERRRLSLSDNSTISGRTAEYRQITTEATEQEARAYFDGDCCLAATVDRACCQAGDVTLSDDAYSQDVVVLRPDLSPVRFRQLWHAGRDAQLRAAIAKQAELISRLRAELETDDE